MHKLPKILTGGVVTFLLFSLFNVPVFATGSLPAPVNFRASSNGSTAITLTWAAVEGAIGYGAVCIGMETNTSTTEAEGIIMDGSATSVILHTNVADNYYCAIAAVDAAGNPGAYAQTQVQHGVRPNGPNLTDARLENGQLYLAWGAVAGATYYEVIWGIDPNMGTYDHKQVGGGVTSVTLSADSSVDNYVGISASNGGLHSDWHMYQIYANVSQPPVPISAPAPQRRSYGTPSTTQSTAPSTPAKPTLKDQKLPDVFLKEGNTTTDISQIDEEGSKSIENFTLDVVGLNKITFLEPVDLSSEDFFGKVSKLNEYVRLDQIGFVELKKDDVGQLNKSAEIEMRGLPYHEQPRILKDGKLPKEGEVWDVSYDKENRILKFKVRYFSEYRAVPVVGLDPVKISENESEFVVTGEVNDPAAEVTIYFGDQEVKVENIDEITGEFAQKLDWEDDKPEIIKYKAKNSIGESALVESKVEYVVKLEETTFARQLRGLLNRERLTGFLLGIAFLAVVIVMVGVYVVYRRYGESILGVKKVKKRRKMGEPKQKNVKKQKQKEGKRSSKKPIAVL